MFKLILSELKKNLKSGCSDFYFRGSKKLKNTNIYSLFLGGGGRLGGSFEPHGLEVEQLHMYLVMYIYKKARTLVI